GVYALCGAADLTSGLSNRFRCLQLQARDALRRLPAFDVRARPAGVLVGVSERLGHRHADAPRRVVGSKRLTDRVAEAARAGAGDDAGEAAISKELAASEPRAPIRRLEADVRKPLVVEKRGCRLGVLELQIRASDVEALFTYFRDCSIHIRKFVPARRLLSRIETPRPERRIGGIHDEASQSIL